MKKKLIILLSFAIIACMAAFIMTDEKKHQLFTLTTIEESVINSEFTSTSSIDRFLNETYECAEVPSARIENTISTSIVATDVGDLPTEYCLRDYAYIYTEDQAGFGMCYTFSWMKALEHAILNEYGEFYDFSEAWLPLCNVLETSNAIYGDGGYPCLEIAQEYGLVLESDMPYDLAYTIGDDNLRDIYNIYEKYANTTIVQNLIEEDYRYSEINRDKSIEIVKNAILNGGVCASIATRNLCTISEGYCDRIQILKVSSGTMDHQITLIGFDDEFVYVQEDIEYVGAWIALNSWGENTTNGVFYIPYDCWGKGLFDIVCLSFQESKDIEVKINSQPIYNIEGTDYSSIALYDKNKYYYSSVKENPTTSAIKGESEQNNICYANSKIKSLIYTVDNNYDERVKINYVKILMNNLDVTNKFNISYNAGFINPTEYKDIHLSSIDSLESGTYKILIGVVSEEGTIKNNEILKEIYVLSNYGGFSNIYVNGTYSNYDTYINGNNQAINIFGISSETTSLTCYLYLPTYSTITSIQTKDNSDYGILSATFYPSNACKINNGVINYSRDSVYINFKNKCYSEVSVYLFEISYYNLATLTVETTELRINLIASQEDAEAVTPLYIVYDTNGGTNYRNHADSIYVSSLEFEGKIYIYTPKEIENKTFNGWFFDEDFINECSKDENGYYIVPSQLGILVQNCGENDRGDGVSYLILYAKWTSYKVDVYVSGGGNVTNSGSLLVEHNSNVTFNISSNQGFALTYIIINNIILTGEDFTQACVSNKYSLCNVLNDYQLIFVFELTDNAVAKIYYNDKWIFFNTFDDAVGSVVDGGTIVLINDISITTNIKIQKNITFVSSNNSTIKRMANDYIFFIMPGYRITLGSPATNHYGEILTEITFDGNKSEYNKTGYALANRSNINVYEGVNIINFPNGISCGSGDTLNIYGGKIYNNAIGIASQPVGVSNTINIYGGKIYSNDKNMELLSYTNSSTIVSISGGEISNTDSTKTNINASATYQNSKITIELAGNPNISGTIYLKNVPTSHISFKVLSSYESNEILNVYLNSSNFYTLNSSKPLAVFEDEEHMSLFNCLNDKLIIKKGTTATTENYLYLVNAYQIRWLNYDSSLLKEEKIAEGDIPVYSGVTPTKSPTQTEEYIFNGWSPEISQATSDAEYTAQFTSKSITKYFTIIIQVNNTENGTVSLNELTQIAVGTLISVNDNILTIGDKIIVATPTTSNEQYSFSFVGWTNLKDSVMEDMEIVANFSRTLNTYLITISHSSNGSITPSTNQVVNYGTSLELAFEADLGYELTKLLIDGNDVTSSISNNKYTISNIKENHTVSAIFDLVSYTITAITSANGTITPEGTSNVLYGEGLNYTFTPNTGYKVKDVEIDGVSIGAVNYYTFINVDTDHTISVEFEIQKFTITFDTRGGTLISGNLSQTINYGANASAPLLTREGYTQDGWDKPLTNIIADTTIIAKWKPITYVITYNLMGGTNHLSNPTNYTIESDTIVFQDASKEGYDFAGWYSNSNFTGDKVQTVNQGSIGDLNLYAKFIAIECLVVFDLDSSRFGNISCIDGDLNNLKYGDSLTFEVTPDTGYEVDKVFVNDVETTVTDNKFTVSNIQENTNIRVTYKESSSIVTPPNEDTLNVPNDSSGLDDNAKYIIYAGIGSIVLLLAVLIIIMSKNKKNKKKILAMNNNKDSQYYSQSTYNHSQPENTCAQPQRSNQTYNSQKVQQVVNNKSNINQQANPILQKALEFVKDKEQHFISFCNRYNIDYQNNYNNAVLRYYQAYLRSIKK